MSKGTAGRGRSRDHRRFNLWSRLAVATVLVAALLVVRDSAPRAENPATGIDRPVPAAANKPTPETLQPEGWTVQASSESAGHPADAVLDDDSETYWNSKPSASATNTIQQSITIDMRGPQTVSDVAYEPRHGNRPAGVIGRFEISVSADGVHFTPAASGTWANTTNKKHIGIQPVATRFVRLTARSFAAGSGTSVAVAGISLQGALSVEAPVSPPTLSTDPSLVGQWGPTIGFPLVPVAAALLPNNKLLVWS